MTSAISLSFATQRAALTNYLAEHFCWPSPDAGFALFVFHELGLELPLAPQPEIKFRNLQASTQAPELAAIGYAMVCQQGTVGKITPEGWVDAFSRLTERDPFPLDRHSFTYRPVELLGVTLGAYCTPQVPGKHRTWLCGVLNDAPKKSVTSAWAKYLVATARIVAGLSDGLPGPESLETLSLEELALLVWLTSSETFRTAGTWKQLAKPDLHRHFLERCLKVEPSPSDAGTAALLDAAIQISTNSLLESEIASNWQLRSSTRDAAELVVRICRRFHLCARQLLNRHDDRVTIKMKDEYDVQDLMHALLRLHFEDIRPEEWTPSYAGSSARMDFLLKRERVVVETKMTRRNLQQKEITKQLIEDKAHYSKHPDCDALVCFVYDPDGYCKNPIALENDVSEKGSWMLVRVVVGPQGR